MLEKEAQEKFLVALYLLLKENPNAQFHHDEVAQHAGLAEDMTRVTTSILPNLQSKGLITMMGLRASRIPLMLTPNGLERAEHILENQKETQDDNSE